MCMLIVGKVELVSTHEFTIRTVQCELPAPAVVRLPRYVRKHMPRVRLSRQTVHLRDDHKCQYCGRKATYAELSIDHVLPRCRGGGTTWRNVVTACLPCNRRKGHHLPEEAGMHLCKRPERPRWLSTRVVEIPPDQLPPSWQLYLRTG